MTDNPNQHSAELANEQSELFKRTSGEILTSLAALYDMCKDKNEEHPLELQEKLTLYGSIYELMGDMEAFVVGQKELAYAYRQEMKAKTFLYGQSESGKKLTGAEREMVAEVAVTKFRRAEAKFTEESKKWKNRRDATLEQINIMKRKQDGLGALWEKANHLNGYA